MNKDLTVCMLILFVTATFAILTGCSPVKPNHRSSSVLQYLYPDENNINETPGIPRLELPLRVGVAFVPESSTRFHALTERDKFELMKEVSRHFKKHDFVKSIDLIPSAYLIKEGSFANLDQIRTMHGVDVIALLSYDQTQFTDEGIASITYWTLIGAYIVPGEKNDTHTMVDASVYDLKSRKMLFRAPGTSHIKSKATPVNLSEQLREDSIKSFKMASTDLAENLEIQLDLFKEKVKEAPGEYQVINREGYTGAGELDLSHMLFLLFSGAYSLWLRRKTKA